MTDDSLCQIAIHALPNSQGATFYATNAPWDRLQHAYDKDIELQVAALRQKLAEGGATEPASSATPATFTVNELNHPTSSTHNFVTLIASDIPDNLEHVVAPSQITRISKKAFTYKSGMRSIELGADVTDLGLLSFSNCGLTSFNAPTALRSIGEKTFSRCLNLTEVRLNDGLEYIGANAFANTPLPHIEIPASVRKIALGAFPTTCEIIINRNNPYLKIDDAGCLYRRIKSGWILEEATRHDMTECIVAPDTIAIAERAFAQVKALERVTLPDGLLSIGVGAFKGCKNLTTIRIPESLLSIGDGAFYNTALSSIYLPARMEHLGALALATIGSDMSQATHTLNNVEVNPQNRRFYTQDSLLIERHAHYRKRSVATPGRPNLHAKMDIARRTDLNVKNHTVRITTRGGVIGSTVSVDLDAMNMNFVDFEEPELNNKQNGEGTSTATPEPTTHRRGRKYGHHRVVAFFGNAKHVTIPHSCDAVAPYAFAGVSCIDELRIHVGLDKVDLCAFSIGRAIPRIYIDIDSTPGVLHFDFPINERAKREIFQSFRSGKVVPAIFALASDDSMYTCRDIHLRAKHALERLRTPRYLTVTNAGLFDKLIRLGLPRICDTFAEHDDAEGFGLLFELGYINERNVTEIIERVASGKNVAMTGYLLEQKRRRFAQTLLDFDI